MINQKTTDRNQTLRLENPDALGEFAKNFAQDLLPGDFVALTGPLGSGKTTFVKALCHHLGSPDTVTSPTFALINHYRAPAFPIVHADFYRLVEAPSDTRDIEAELDTPGALILVEWADLQPDIPWTWHLAFDYPPESDGETVRILTVCYLRSQAESPG